MKVKALTFVSRKQRFANRTGYFANGVFPHALLTKAVALMSHEPVDLLIIMLGTNDTKERFAANAANVKHFFTLLDNMK